MLQNISTKDLKPTDTFKILFVIFTLVYFIVYILIGLLYITPYTQSYIDEQQSKIHDINKKITNVIKYNECLFYDKNVYENFIIYKVFIYTNITPIPWFIWIG